LLMYGEILGGLGRDVLHHPADHPSRIRLQRLCESLKVSAFAGQRICMRSKAWLAARVSLRLACLPPLQAGCGAHVAYACGCARPSYACFGHKTVKADHI
jgi:hypothetical protein